MELDLDALQVLPADQETTEMACTWTCDSYTCDGQTCLYTS